MKLLLIISIMLMGMSIGLWAQDFYEINTINEVRLIFTQSNWDQLLDQYFFAGLEQRLMGTCIINGVTYDSVGVRYKGNSSYNPTRVKNPLNIKLDYVREDQLLDGKYGTVKLSNGFSDPSMVRETLGYEIARKYMPASRANYANVYINNNLIGLYTSVQDVDSEFMREHLHCSGKPRFKCDTNSFSPIPVWGYLGADSTFYTSYYGLESDEGWDTLINFTNVMSNNPAELPYVMNIDQNLWMIAFDNLLANLDSPIQVFHNFYLFGDSDNRINPLLWDLNMCFGGFRQNMTLTSMQNMDPLRYQNSTQFLLISRMLSNPRYKKMYLAHMRTMLTENFSNGWYATRAVELQTICGPSFQADPNKFFSYTNFQNNLNSSVPGSSGGSICGITELMNVRAAYVANHTSMSGTVPAIESINCTTPEPVAYSTVSFTMATSNATYAQLGIRQNIKDKFTYHQMYDDGLHEDGAASDGLYGVSVQLGYGDLQYYGWAENASQGVFLPARAEHEFFELPVTLNPGELIINEIQAKNVSTIADPNGEYDDWVEIYNPNNYPVDIAGMYMTDNHYSNGITAWTQIPSVSSLATTIPAHGYLVVWFDEQPTQGPLHINNKLGASADAVYLIDANGTTVIDSKSWTDATGLNADDVSFGRYPDGASTWQLFGAGQTNPCTPGATNLGTVNAAPVISAIQYSPLNTTASTPITISAQVTDEDNNLSTVQLHWGLTNVTENTTTMLLQSGRYSASIGTFNLGSTIRYCIKAVDDLGAQTISRTYNIIIGYQTPTLYINEVMPANTLTITDNYGEYEDWVEIYNPNSFAVNLAGYYLVDNHYGDDTFTIYPISASQPDSTTIPANGYKLFWFDEDTEQGVLHINNKLASVLDAVYLLAPDLLTVIDNRAWVEFTALTDDLSLGRYPDGSDVWYMFGIDVDYPVTPGFNNAPLNNQDDNLTAPLPSLEIYPNPFKDHLNISIDNAKSVSKISIYNLKGQLVSEFTVNQGTKAVWNGTDQKGNRLGNGVYIVTADTGRKVLSSKICIIH